MARQLLVAQPRGCGARLMEWTAIPAERDSEGEVAVMSLGRSLAVFAVLLSALVALALPAAVALGIQPVSVAVAAGGGLLAVAATGLKSAALVWGLASRGGEPVLRPSVP